MELLSRLQSWLWLNILTLAELCVEWLVNSLIDDLNVAEPFTGWLTESSIDSTIAEPSVQWLFYKSILDELSIKVTILLGVSTIILIAHLHTNFNSFM